MRVRRRVNIFITDTQREGLNENERERVKKERGGAGVNDMLETQNLFSYFSSILSRSIIIITNVRAL